ncbi:Stomatin-like protein 1 [Saguinus oedipus]|uniref:Stomatin-like protein 1 n=1 Tax=Saguinus oedipus TaxID=9490 RepID=A0ABQ9V1Q9_SAGOE|nr:Stomatin-like protein 1 [Saguinus oedipus]
MEEFSPLGAPRSLGTRHLLDVQAKKTGPQLPVGSVQLTPSALTADAPQSWPSCLCHGLISFLGFLLLLVTFPISGWFALKIVPTYERMIVFRLGRIRTPQGPGMVLLLPFIDSFQRVDLRTRAFSIPPCKLASKDGAVLSVGADVQFRIWDPVLSVMTVKDLNTATRMTAQNAMTKALLKRLLREIQMEKLKISEQLLEVAAAEILRALPLTAEAFLGSETALANITVTSHMPAQWAPLSPSLTSPGGGICHGGPRPQPSESPAFPPCLSPLLLPFVLLPFSFQAFITGLFSSVTSLEDLICLGCLLPVDTLFTMPWPSPEAPLEINDVTRAWGLEVDRVELAVEAVLQPPQDSPAGPNLDSTLQQLALHFLGGGMNSVAGGTPSLGPGEDPWGGGWGYFAAWCTLDEQLCAYTPCTDVQLTLTTAKAVRGGQARRECKRKLPQKVWRTQWVVLTLAAR